MWDVLLADLAALGEGRADGVGEAARDRDGVLWRFAFLYVESDEAMRCNDFGFAHFSGRDEVCSECFANRSN